MPRRSLDVGTRPTCPDHPGSRVWIDRRARRWSAYHETLRFRCVSKDGSGRHWLRSRVTRRHPTEDNLIAREMLLEDISPLGGYRTGYSYLFSNLEIATTLVRAGRGETYREVSAGFRSSIYRFRLEPRPGPVQERAPRSIDRAPAVRPPGTYRRNYTQPKQPADPGSRVSKQANLTSAYIDAYAGPILDHFAYSTKPRGAMSLTSSLISPTSESIGFLEGLRPARSASLIHRATAVAGPWAAADALMVEALGWAVAA